MRVVPSSGKAPHPSPLLASGARGKPGRAGRLGGHGARTARALCRLAAAGAILLSACAPTHSPPTRATAPAAAWWVDLKIEPTGSEVLGIDVRRIDKHWRQASVLDGEWLRRVTSVAQYRQFADSGLSLSLQTDLDADGTPEHIVVGVYRTDLGETGRFLAVFVDGRIQAHFSERGAAGFSALIKEDRAVRWYKCVACGAFDSLRVIGKSLIIE